MAQTIVMLLTALGFLVFFSLVIHSAGRAAKAGRRYVGLNDTLENRTRYRSWQWGGIPIGWAEHTELLDRRVRRQTRGQAALAAARKSGHKKRH